MTSYHWVIDCRRLKVNNTSIFKGLDALVESDATSYDRETESSAPGPSETHDSYSEG